MAVIVSVLAGIWFGGSPSMLLLFAVASAAATTDSLTGRIPNGLTLGGFIAVVVEAATRASPFEQILDALGGAAIVSLLLLSIWLLTYWMTGKPGIGMGDVKLGLVVGGVLGASGLWALYLSALTGAIVGGLGLMLGVTKRTTPLPFAPCIAVGIFLQLWIPFSRAASWLSALIVV
jgi:leader peptidase (prepilin peptidase)/N-methyltransferase